MAIWRTKDHRPKTNDHESHSENIRRRLMGQQRNRLIADTCLTSLLRPKHATNLALSTSRQLTTVPESVRIAPAAPHSDNTLMPSQPGAVRHSGAIRAQPHPLRGKVLFAYIVLCLVWGATFLAIRVGVQHFP